MLKFSWILIAIMLLHGLFTCAVAVGHVQDGQHTFDYQSHHNHTHDTGSQGQSDTEHEHQFHAHISCITGYSVHSCALCSPELAIGFRPLSFNNNHTQPPIPPPDS